MSFKYQTGVLYSSLNLICKEEKQVIANQNRLCLARLLFAQENIWLITKLDTKKLLLNVANAFKFRDFLNTEVLQQQRITELELMSASQRHQLLVEWNDTAVDYPLHKCLHQQFEEQVERSPNAVALVYENQALSYQELNSRANQLAHHLQTLGVKPEVMVGICVERSLEMMVGLLSILKAGAAYVPIDPESPQERLAYILDDSQITVLLTQTHLVGNLPPHNAEIVCLDSDWKRISEHQQTNPSSGVTSENMAYVIYTSGSTGKPKGVINAHRGICNRLLWMQDAYQFKTTDCFLQKTPIIFDVSIWECFCPLLIGARLVIAESGGHRDNLYLVNIIAQEQVTVVHFVPSMLQIFLESRELERCQSLKRVFCSGEALPFSLQERFFGLLKCELHNLYGPTEAAIEVTFWQCQQHSKLRTVPIGRAIANTQLYILNSHLEPVPVGAIGELYIGGVPLARGYLNRPELTEERFILNPFRGSREQGALSRGAEELGSRKDQSFNCDRLYKTGDLARYLPDGNIEYVGRSDFQIKIRGIRIEPGEIEQVLTQHPHVREAVVATKADLLNQQQLVAYIVPQQEEPVPNLLREFLRKNLPEYMVPLAFVILKSLPLTPSGKVDRHLLPEPEWKKAYVTPKNHLEYHLSKIWENVLNIQPIGITDNFFELGGYSLISISLLEEIEKSFGRSFSIATLFQAPTIEQFAKILQEEKSSVSSLIEMTPLNGSRQPLFWCTQNFKELVPLARYLGADQPLFGLESGYLKISNPATHVKDYASRYVEEIRATQPEGPYFLGGFCFGGIIAVEIAQQLQAQGQKVALLALLESYGADSIYQYYESIISKFDIEHLLQLNLAQQMNYFLGKVKRSTIRTLSKLAKNNRKRNTFAETISKATNSSVPQATYQGEFILFFAKSDQRPLFGFFKYGWGNLLSNNHKIYIVPGKHANITKEPYVQPVAETLRFHINKLSHI